MTFNKLKLQRGDDYVLYKNFTIHHPTLGEIVDLQGDNEDKYALYLSLLTSISLDIADILWVEQNVWYEDIKSEWMFFLEKCSIESTPVVTYKVLDDGLKTMPHKTIMINREYGNALKYFTRQPSTFVIEEDDNKNIILVCATIDANGMFFYDSNSFVFSEHSYIMCRQFLKRINWSASKEYNVVKGGTKYAKKYILENEYKIRMDDLKKKRESSVTLDSITSSLMAKGISVTEIWNMPIYLVYNLYYRYIQFANWDGTTTALYTGNIDTKKHPVNWTKINWSKVID